MLRMNTTQNTRAAPQQYEKALASLGFIAKVAKHLNERGRSAAEIDRGRFLPTRTSC